MNWRSMQEIIDRCRYDTDTATLLADNCYWDGSNFERSGRNTFLFRAPGGAYFAQHLTQWQGEQDSLEVLDPDAAYELYESLSEKAVEVGEGFPDVVIADA